MSELNKELCTLVCKEVAWFHEQFKQCRAACHKCGDYRRLEQRLKMYKGDVLFEVQEEMEKVFGNTPDIIYGIVDVLLKMHHEEAK